MIEEVLVWRGRVELEVVEGGRNEEQIGRLFVIISPNPDTAVTS